METHLANCPFCGGKAFFHEEVLGAIVMCSVCNVGSNEFKEECEAIAAWNRREDGWVSVQDRLPECNDGGEAFPIDVMMQDGVRLMLGFYKAIGEQQDDAWFDHQAGEWFETREVKLWRYLPASPADAEKGEDYE